MVEFIPTAIIRTPDTVGIPFFHFLFGNVPENVIDDVLNIVIFLLVLVTLDVLTAFLRESKKCLQFHGKEVTPIHLIYGLWLSLWPYVDESGKERRFIFSKRLRTGLAAKLEMYPIFIAISVWSFHIPDHWGLFGLELDDLLIYGFTALPILMEVYSILENLMEIEPTLFNRLYRVVKIIRNLLKGG